MVGTATHANSRARRAVGEEKAAVGYKDRSEALRAEMSHWYGKIKWWMHLKRAGFVPQFEVWKRKD